MSENKTELNGLFQKVDNTTESKLALSEKHGTPAYNDFQKLKTSICKKMGDCKNQKLFQALTHFAKNNEEQFHKELGL